MITAVFCPRSSTIKLMPLMLLISVFEALVSSKFLQSSLPKKDQPDKGEHRDHEGHGVFQDETEEAGRVDLLLVGDGFDHEVGTVADVGIRAEKHRTDADRDDVVVQVRVAEEESHFNV